MKNHSELIKAIIPEIEKGLNLLTLKGDVAAILKNAHSTLDTEKFNNVLVVAEDAFSEHCGCADELQDLELILDDLYDIEIINKETYQKIIENTACNRWL